MLYDLEITINPCVVTMTAQGRRRNRMEQKVLGHHESEWCLYGICSEDEGKVVFHTRDKMFHYLPSHCKEIRSFYLNNVRDVFESKGTKLGWFKDLF